MKTWARTPGDTFCGGPCQKQLAVGTPVLEFRLLGLHRPKVRCAACAGEPVPDLPLLAAPPPVERLRVLRRLGMLPLDEGDSGLPLSCAQSHARTREVGEEG